MTIILCQIKILVVLTKEGQILKLNKKLKDFKTFISSDVILYQCSTSYMETQVINGQQVLSIQYLSTMPPV